MRSENNPLDLNNLPDDFSRDGNKPVFEVGSSSTGCSNKKKKNSGKDECEKVYECRFCSLKFCKSQALGGHMNRHRQERETEAMNKARQMVFGDNNIAVPHLGCQSIAGPYQYHHSSSSISEPSIPSFRSVYSTPPTTTRLFSAGPSTAAPLLQPPPSQQPSYLYSSPSQSTRLVPSYHAQIPVVNDYYLGHVLGSGGGYGSVPESNYTCIGAPVGSAVQDHHHHSF